MSKNNNLKFYSVLKAIFGPVFRLFMRIKPIGAENVPKTGGIVLCSNHIAAFDVIAIAAVCPRQLSFVAKKELFSVPVIGWLIKRLGAISVDRGGNDVSAIKASVKAAEDGKVLSIFPQGTRCPGINPKTTPLRNGAALIAYHAKCDVVPVCLKMKNCKYGFFRKIEVIFGETIPYEALGFEKGGREEYAAVTEKIFAKVTELTDYSYLPDYDPSLARKKKRKKRK